MHQSIKASKQKSAERGFKPGRSALRPAPARSAHRLARLASGVAGRGGRAVAKVVVAMERIDTRSGDSVAADRRPEGATPCGHAYWPAQAL